MPGFSNGWLIRLKAAPFRAPGSIIQVKRERQEKLLDLNSGSPWETVTLTTLARDRALFSSLLAEARDLALQGNEGRTVIYIARGIEWSQFGRPRRKRELRSVVLADGVADKINQDVQSFMDRGRWYTERGIPYRRGYLLHGPPGSGKSSFIQALAGSLGYNICVLNISERGLTDDRLNYLLAHVPERSFVLLEDIDAAFNKRVQTSDDGYQSGVTFSGLLNALDGVASGEERIVFMTTNHLSRLDPALVRPGRVDLIQLLDDAQPGQAAQLFARFYGKGHSEQVPGKMQDDDQSKIQSLAEKVKKITTSEINDGKRASMAALQGHFILHDAESAVKTLTNCFKAAGPYLGRVSRRWYATAIPLAPPKPPKPPAPPADPNRIYTPRKTALHSEYSATIQNSPFFIILGHQNFSVAKFTALRKNLAKIKPSKGAPVDQPPAKLSVIRHAIFGAAIKSTQPQAVPLIPSVQGPAAILTFPSLDPPHLKSALRAIERAIPKPRPGAPVDHTKPKLHIIGAYAEGQVFQFAAIQNLSTLPTLDTLRAQLIGLLSAPAAQLAGVLDQARGGRLSRTLEGLKASLKENEKEG
ncbi:unnamed protein product [Rhizoctonia solani]|uniref:Mitochondrial chaperone BCS1 n=1 Tax=Rhizoctonia solani TaxID=456999 RepID=A0A8H2XK97_9AGAM|nr:unnamed protein product [Rhizoctonia solani]